MSFEDLFSIPDHIKHEVEIKPVNLPQIIPDHVDVKLHVEIPKIIPNHVDIKLHVPKPIVIQHKLEVDRLFIIMALSSIPLYFYSKRKFKI
jgi:ribosome-associated translation inhibitor RaiA